VKKRILTITISLLIAVMVATPCFANDTLILENKDPVTWTVIEDTIQATVTYTPAGETFDYSLTGVVGGLGVSYSLIYYADPWPGDNPGALLGEGTSDVLGNIAFDGSLDFPVGLPIEPDKNYPDGAKIWLVTSDDYNPDTNAMTGWDPTAYLYESNLITYKYAKPYASSTPSWFPVLNQFSLWYGGIESYNWIDGNALPAIDRTASGFWNGVSYTMRVVIPEGTEVYGGYCLRLVYGPDGLTLRPLDGGTMTFSNPVTISTLVNGEWVETSNTVF